MASDLTLESRNRRCLHDSLCRLGLDHDFLAEHQLLACFCGWLLPGLDHAEPWKNELARLLHLLSSNLGQRVQDFAHVALLEFGGIGQSSQKASLGHGLLTLGLHRTVHLLGLGRLHDLHCGRHGEGSERSKNCQNQMQLEPDQLNKAQLKLLRLATKDANQPTIQQVITV